MESYDKKNYLNVLKNDVLTTTNMQWWGVQKNKNDATDLHK